MATLVFTPHTLPEIAEDPWRREGDLNPRGPERPQANRYTLKR
jgi:hypothetical protein